MPVYVFLGLKGGVGKTTAARSCAAEWLRRGRSTLLVDADEQQTAVMWAIVAAENGRPAPEVVRMNETMHLPGNLPALTERFDVIVIDTPPRLNAVARSALMVSDVAVLPCGPSADDTWALAPTAALIAEARSVHNSLISRILVTRKMANTSLGREIRQVLSSVSIPTLKSELCYRVDYQEAGAAGLGPTTYRPAGMASLEVRNLVDELDELTELRPYGRSNLA